MEDNKLLRFDDFINCDFELLDGNSSVRLVDDWMRNLIEKRPDSSSMDGLDTLVPRNSGDIVVLEADQKVIGNKQNQPTFIYCLMIRKMTMCPWTR